MIVFAAVEWMDAAACKDMTPAEADRAFFASGGVSKRTAALCNSCPVRLKCLSYAQQNTEEYGVWGGIQANYIHAAAAKASPHSNGGGQGSNKTKLTDDDVRTIRRRFDSGERYADIALDYDASRAAVRKVALRIHFKYVSEDAVTDVTQAA